MASGKLQRFLFCVLLFGIVMGVFWKATAHEFVFDDHEYLVENKQVQSGLTAQSLKWAFTAAYASNWHPLTWISHELDYELYGSNPMGHHLTSVLIHAINAVLLLLILSRMTGSFWPSAFVAAVFCLHPLRLESVAWVAERKDVLSMLFLLLTVIAYAHYVRKPRVKSYLIVAVAYALGLMAKPMLVTLPLVLIILDYWPLGRLKSADGKAPKLRRLLVEKTPLFVMAAGSCVITFMAQQHSGAVFQVASMPFLQRMDNATVSYVLYLKKMLWPTDLAIYYPYPHTGLPAWQVVGSVLILASLTFLALRYARSQGYLCAGWLWYVITLIPVIGLVQVGGQAAADRYTYIPMVGILIAVAWGLPEIARRILPQRAATMGLSALAIGSILLLSSSTRSQIDYWQDDSTLFTHALDVTTDNWMAHYSLGHVAELDEDLDGAREHYAEAVRIRPGSGMVQSAYGSVLLRQGNPGLAATHLAKAIALGPDSATAHNNLGGALEQLGDRDTAVREFKKAVALDPDLVSALDNLGTVLARQADYSESSRYLKRACQVTNDSDMMLLVKLAEVSHRAGRQADATIAITKALHLAREQGQVDAARQIRAIMDGYTPASQP